MRFRKIDRYLLLLALLFVLAVLRRSDLPGEEVLPDLYSTAVHGPLLAQAAAAANEDELDRVRLRSELAAARYRIRQLEDQLSAAQEQARYLRELRWEASPVAVPGWVFAVDPNRFRRTFLIDLGLEDGVDAGMPVVVGRALLGVVLSARKRESTVQRVDDASFTMEVEIHTDEGAVPGVARGTGDRSLDVRLIRRAASLRVGDWVYTTRYHPEIPPGLVVGRVEEVDDLDQDEIPEVRVAPLAALGRWAQITVLKSGR